MKNSILCLGIALSLPALLTVRSACAQSGAAEMFAFQNYGSLTPTAYLKVAGSSVQYNATVTKLAAPDGIPNRYGSAYAKLNNNTSTTITSSSSLYIIIKAFGGIDDQYQSASSSISLTGSGSPATASGYAPNDGSQSLTHDPNSYSRAIRINVANTSIAPGDYIEFNGSWSASAAGA